MGGITVVWQHDVCPNCLSGVYSSENEAAVRKAAADGFYRVLGDCPNCGAEIDILLLLDGGVVYTDGVEMLDEIGG